MNEARETEMPEDRETPSREPIFNLPAIVLAIILLCAGVHLLRLYVLTPQQDVELLIRAAFIPVRYSGQYDLDFYAFSSPFTYTFLHGGWAHLIVNMIWLAAFGSPLANRIGALRFALFFAVTGFAAAFFFFVIHPTMQAPLVGASGSISGMMGAAARFAFHVDRSSGKGAFAGPLLPFGAVFRSRAALTFLAVWMVINIVTGVVGFVPGEDSQIAWEAHIGGFLAGFLGLRFFDRRQAYGR
ncbi:rhomboid family intramembrane serine protease [Mesorhizobium sp. 1M-11]|uniref:rhomboid family intramembrane serine protease n=1 Tax=Mesorhizobium sp. 1M-11 TaxID=1529006 RepID=UPI0006C76B0C|nr:rhomboid family intramembrane serine protease [Mesorhizobium sp. 1M-11]